MKKTLVITMKRYPQRCLLCPVGFVVEVDPRTDFTSLHAFTIIVIKCPRCRDEKIENKLTKLVGFVTVKGFTLERTEATT